MKRAAFKFTALVIVTLLLNPMAFSQTEAGMSLGKMKFIQAPSIMTKEARTIKMTMSRKVITPRFCAKVGGVAFVQIAEPDFVVNTFSLKCDRDSNAAFAIINGSTFKIPLEVWQLKPIAKYADDQYNAAVTLFGSGKCKILFHDAFIDELIGLRLLQTDLLLASNFLDSYDRGKLPSDESGEFIMSESEKTLWDLYSTIYQLQYKTTYDTMSLYASEIINYVMDSIGEDYSTYVYTDFGEPITFSIEDDILKTRGYPYYRFTSDSKIMDTIETYPEIISFLDSVEARKNHYCNTLAKNAYTYSSMPITCAIKEIVDSKKNNLTKAEETFAITNYYKMQDSVSSSIIALSDYLLRGYLIDYIDSVSLFINEDDPRVPVCTAIMEIVNNESIYDAPALVEYAKTLMDMDLSDSLSIYINEIFNYTNLGNDDILIYHMFRNGIHKPIFAEQLTNYLKENRYVVNLLNPIVINAAETTCQWAAFFRYAKQKNPQNWKLFLKQINTLKYDAPMVRTPIGIERK